MRQQTEYGLAAILVAYIVFATRPAPAAITSVLAQPVAQLAALGLVVYVGSQFSLLVALLLGLAFVLSTPTREYADDPSIKKSDKTADKTEKKTEEKKVEKHEEKKVEKHVSLPSAKHLAAKPKPHPTVKPAVKPTKPAEEPAAAGQKVGKETFVSSLAATAADF